MYQLLELQLQLRGREVATHTFRQDIIHIGRNPKSDIYIDNPGISWDHAVIGRNKKGNFVVKDLDSANGTFVNRRSVRKARVRDGDTIGLGKFALRVAFKEDRRKKGGPFSQTTTDVEVEPAGPTFALTRSEIARLMAKVDLPRSEDSLLELDLSRAPPSRKPSFELPPDLSEFLQRRWAPLLFVFGFGLLVGALATRCMG